MLQDDLFAWCDRRPGHCRLIVLVWSGTNTDLIVADREVEDVLIRSGAPRRRWTPVAPTGEFLVPTSLRFDIVRELSS